MGGFLVQVACPNIQPAERMHAGARLEVIAKLALRTARDIHQRCPAICSEGTFENGWDEAKLYPADDSGGEEEKE